jgi:hypothetical protein
VEAKGLGETCRMIRGLIADPAARLSVAVETGPDEATFVGTVDAYLRLALAALEFVADAQAGLIERRSVGEVQVVGTASFGSVFASGDFAVSAGWLTGSIADAETLAEYVLRISPPSD